MSHEHNNTENVGMVCESCAPKPGKFTGQDPNSFMGKLVKLAFKAFNPRTQSQTKEHMWVRPQMIEEGIITGILLNYPVLETEFNYGDAVSFRVSEIEDAIEDNGPKAN